MRRRGAPNERVKRMQLPESAQPQQGWEKLEPNRSRAYLLTKRGMDLFVSVLGLIVSSPILLIAALAIKLEDPKGKVFYRQKRVGKNGSIFWCHKLRSMYADADARKAALMARNEMDGPVFKIRNDPRITKVGRVLRKLSIDELPQLYDVLIGKMSLVGPRPLPVSEAEACTAYQRQRELVKPGITCYWQVSGRNRLPFRKWIELDLKYIREQSLWTDLKILFRTIPAVLSGGGY